jgi:hypothetical protein
MIAYPEIINAPNQTVLLDLSKIDTANYAQSEILVVVQSSDQNTILVLPSASQIVGSPTIYILATSDIVNLKVKAPPDGAFASAISSDEIDYGALKIVTAAFKFMNLKSYSGYIITSYN